MVAVALAFELQDEIAVLAFRLQVAGPVDDLDGAVVDCELRFLAGEDLPAGEVLAIEERPDVRGPQFDISQAEIGATLTLKADGRDLTRLRPAKNRHGGAVDADRLVMGDLDGRFFPFIACGRKADRRFFGAPGLERSGENAKFLSRAEVFEAQLEIGVRTGVLD